MNTERKFNQPSQMPTGEKKEEMIRVDGKAQVLDLLRIADAEYREILLRGIERKDPRLARELRAAL
jgi:hypothetical protein